MWKKVYSKFYSDVSVEQLWKVLTAIDQWPKWHDDLEYCKLSGEFEVGNSFTLKPKNAPSVNVVLTDIVEHKRFTDCTHFFGAKMYNTHTLKSQDGGVVISNEVLVTGPLRWLWIKLVAQNVVNSLPSEFEALVALARKSK